MPKFSGTHFLKRGGGEVEVRPPLCPKRVFNGKTPFSGKSSKGKSIPSLFFQRGSEIPLGPFSISGKPMQATDALPPPPSPIPRQKNTRPKKGEQRRKRVWVGGWVFTPSPKATHKKGKNVYRLKDASPFLPPPSLTSEWDGGRGLRKKKKGSAFANVL